MKNFRNLLLLFFCCLGSQAFAESKCSKDSEGLCFWSVHNKLAIPVTVSSDKETKNVPSGGNQDIFRSSSFTLTAVANGDAGSITSSMHTIVIQKESGKIKFSYE